MSEEQIQGYIDDFNAEMDKYYSADNVCRQTYKEINEQILRKNAKDTIMYTVDGGVLDCTCRHIKLSADGTSATMDVVLVNWGNWVEQNEYGQIEVTAPTGQDTASYRYQYIGGASGDVWQRRYLWNDPGYEAGVVKGIGRQGDKCRGCHS